MLDFQEITPLYDIAEVTASFKELLDPSFYHTINRENYLQIYLKDRAVIPNMMNQLRAIYPRILGVERVNGRHRSTSKRQTLEIKQPKNSRKRSLLKWWMSQ